MLTSDLDGNDTRDRASLDAVLSALVTQLNMSSFDLSTVAERTASREVQLVVMRLLSKTSIYLLFFPDFLHYPLSFNIQVHFSSEILKKSQSPFI